MYLFNILIEGLCAIDLLNVSNISIEGIYYSYIYILFRPEKKLVEIFTNVIYVSLNYEEKH